MIYDFCLGNDFIKQGERNIPFFVINLIISFIISIFGCIYNDFIVLFCCGLEKNTYDQISRRAKNTGAEIEFKIIEDLDNPEDDI